MSGILQQGYTLGYVFAACANLGVGGSTDSWKTVFGKIYMLVSVDGFALTCVTVRHAMSLGTLDYI